MENAVIGPPKQYSSVRTAVLTTFPVRSTAPTAVQRGRASGQGYLKQQALSLSRGPGEFRFSATAVWPARDASSRFAICALHLRSPLLANHQFSCVGNAEKLCASTATMSRVAGPVY